MELQRKCCNQITVAHLWQVKHGQCFWTCLSLCGENMEIPNQLHIRSPDSGLRTWLITNSITILKCTSSYLQLATMNYCRKCSSVSYHTLFARTSLMTKEQRCSYLWNPPYDGHGWHCITIPVPPESQVSYCMHQHFSALLFWATVLFCRFGMVWGIHRGCEKSLKYWVIEFAACSL